MKVQKRKDETKWRKLYKRMWIFDNSSIILLITVAVVLPVSLGSSSTELLSACWSSCKGPIIIVGFWWNFNILDGFSRNTQVPNFMKIRPMGADFLPCKWLPTDAHINTTLLALYITPICFSPQRAILREHCWYILVLIKWCFNNRCVHLLVFIWYSDISARVWTK